MKNLCLILSVFFLSVSAAFAQNSVEDIVRLRNRLGIDSSIPIVTGKAASFVKQVNIKVYVAAEKKGARKRFSNWIGKWNKTDGVKYGNLILTSNLSEADVILVSYDRKDEVSPVPRTTVNIFDPSRSRLSPVKKPRVENTLFFPIPTYSYLLVQKPEKIEKFYGNIDRSHPSDGFDSDKALFTRLEELLKF